MKALITFNLTPYGHGILGLSDEAEAEIIGQIDPTHGGLLVVSVGEADVTFEVKTVTFDSGGFRMNGFVGNKDFIGHTSAYVKPKC